MTLLSVSFGALRNACLARGMKARLYVFDAGNTVEISDDSDGHQIIRTTAMHGDEISAPAQAANYLIETGFLNLSDIEGAQ